MPGFTEAAPAKINLALHVTGQRADGYHTLESLVAFAELGDELGAWASDTDKLLISGPFGSQLGNAESNLVRRAVLAFRARWPEAVPYGVAMTLTKNLPIAAGLGGGSADAAAALRLMAAMSGVTIPAEALAEIGAAIGADVPMCLVSRPALVSGIGEVVLPLPSFPALHCVLVNPLQPLATSDVFRRLNSHAFPPLPPLPAMLGASELLAWLWTARNDLEPPATALMPKIGDLIARVGSMQGCALARMSGSGATVFGLFESGAQAHQAAHELRAVWPSFWVAAAPLGRP